MRLRVRNQRQVWAFTALLTAFAVMLPLAIVWTVLSLSPANFSGAFIASGMIIAGMVPLVITPPIAYIMLDMIRTQTDMIRRVDARIMFDMMTGLYNRNHFLDNMRASQANGPIMIVDADHFKAINDSFGHAVGDEALRILANVVKGCVGAKGMVGRLGGEEFGIFMPGKSKAEGQAMANAICEAVRQLHPLIAGKSVKLTVSIGCAQHRAAKVIGHSLKLADDLLYRAKAEGRDRAVYEGDAARQRQMA
jgi:diguanylate cyclase (GGDEF)-like protein